MRFARLFSIEELNGNDVFGATLRSTFYVLLTTLYFLFSIPLVHGATTNFVARTLVGSDTTPPSVPAGLTATPVATSQINLLWGTSTDDYLLSGYQVFRDDVQIATTTSAFYEDTGLVASTTYTYFITAFDSFNNFSASSSPVSTTTLASTTPPVATSTPTGPRYGSRAPRVEILSLQVIPTETGAYIRYETSEYIRSLVRWGVTSSYEAGGSKEGSFRVLHELVLSDLRPDTRYRFSIEGEDSRGRQVSLGEHGFKTLPSVDRTPPGVVTGLTLVKEGNDVHLSWDNPTDADFSHVRIVRSDRFYPSTEVDGWVVYEGGGEGAVDDEVVLPNTRLYYAVFAYDETGNISAGAVAMLRIPPIGGEETPPTGTTSEPLPPIDVAFSDLEFFQDNVKIPVTGNTVTLDGARHITIAMPYRVLPEHLKTVLVRIVPVHDPEKELSFILRVNDAKTAYTARLAPFGVSGTFTVHVSVFDFETKEVGTLRGTLAVMLGSGVYPNDSETHYRTPRPFELWHGITLVLLLLLIFFLVYQILRRKDGEKLSNTKLK